MRKVSVPLTLSVVKGVLASIYDFCIAQLLRNREISKWVWFLGKLTHDILSKNLEVLFYLCQAVILNIL